MFVTDGCIFKYQNLRIFKLREPSICHVYVINFHYSSVLFAIFSFNRLYICLRSLYVFPPYSHYVICIMLNNTNRYVKPVLMYAFLKFFYKSCHCILLPFLGVLISHPRIEEIC